MKREKLHTVKNPGQKKIIQPNLTNRIITKDFEKSTKWKSPRQNERIACIVYKTAIRREKRKKKQQNKNEKILRRKTKSIRVCNITNFELNQRQWYLLFEAQWKPSHKMFFLHSRSPISRFSRSFAVPHNFVHSFAG